MAPNTAPNNNINAYINRVEVELRHDGQAEQHSEHAVPVQQHASYNNKNASQLGIPNRIIDLIFFFFFFVDNKEKILMLKAKTYLSCTA
jgi:hypothetical protein